MSSSSTSSTFAVGYLTLTVSNPNPNPNPNPKLLCCAADFRILNLTLTLTVTGIATSATGFQVTSAISSLTLILTLNLTLNHRFPSNWCHKLIKDGWHGPTAGGPPSQPTWCTNPQYRLQLEHPKEGKGAKVMSCEGLMGQGSGLV